MAVRVEERYAHGMFRETAEYYDLIYSFKDYAGEAAKIAARIRAERPDAQSILDVACGTAEHAKRLVRDIRVDGIDLEPRFVEIAREKVPSGRFEVADMRDFDLGRRYDVVQCLFSSIGYLPSGRDVVAALRCFREHLEPGGLILVEPWLTPEDFRDGHMGMVTAEGNGVKICRMSTSARNGDVSHLHFHYLIGSPERIEHREEIHALTLWTVEEMAAFFAEAGLAARFDPVGLFGRGLWIARATA